jgi:ribosome-binding factor A
MSIRTEKVAGVIMQVLSEPLRKLASEINAGLITVTAVRMSPDLQIAKVYLSAIGGRVGITEVLQALEEENSRIRRFVAQKVQLRFAPELRFYRDETMDTIERIQNLVENTRRDDQAREQKRSSTDSEAV